MLIDAHCHLFKDDYDNLDEVISSFEGIMIINGYDMDSNKEVLELVSKYNNVYGTLGIHPEHANSYKESDLDFVKNNINSPKIVAVGEIGLDYYWVKDNKEKQKELFIKQIKIANELKKPIVIHSRDAIKDTYDILKEYYTGSKFLVHSYAGSIEMARKFIKLGAYLGINGVVTFKNAKNIKEVVKEINLENLVIETDSPYLTPEPFRGKKNKPEYVSYVASKIAEIKAISNSDVEQKTTSNSLDLFDIKEV